MGGPEHERCSPNRIFPDGFVVLSGAGAEVARYESHSGRGECPFSMGLRRTI